MFELSRESSIPLVDQIAERITKLVQHGQLAAGARLPSIRKLAKVVGASPFTVVDAYDRLVARGLIESRAGRGFFVTRRRPAAPLAAIEALPDTGSDALALARLSMSQSTELIAAGSGFLPDHRVAFRITRAGDDIDDYVTYVTDGHGCVHCELPNGVTGKLYIAATDHRPDPDGACGRRWSNTCTLVVTDA